MIAFRVITVCDPHTALRELKRSNDKKMKGEPGKEILLIIDEPMINADLANSPIINKIAEILCHAPKQTILLSATLPSNKQISGLIDVFKYKHPNAIIKRISCQDIQNGIKLINYESGETLSLHDGCKIKNDVTNTMDKYQTNQLLSRLCTPELLYKLDERLDELKLLSDRPSLSDEFKRISDMSHNTVKKVVIDRLKMIEMECSDKEIEQIFSITSSKADKIDFFKLGTTEAHKCLGQCLIVAVDPAEFALKYFAEMFEDLKSFKEMLDQYNSKKKIFDDNLKKDLRMLETATTKQDKTLNKDSRSQHENEIKRKKSQQ